MVKNVRCLLAAKTDPKYPASLSIRNRKNQPTFSFGKKETMMNGRSYRCRKADTSVIYDATDGTWRTKEMSNPKIQSMGRW